jgi:phosphoribosylformimino-5-aminoimidazole carboxamide ribotide isomerase
MRIIIAIDIIDGKCVRLTRGDFDTKKVYNEDPLEIARMLEDNGIKYIHLVDLDGAREKKIINHRTLEKIAGRTGLIIDFGGGIRSDDDVRAAFDSGARQVTAGSIAATDRDLFIRWLLHYGNDSIILGADFRERKISVSGWTETLNIDITDYISDYYEKGVKYTICTDAERDGMLEGPATDVYREILEKTGISLIASGGVSELKDLDELRDIGCEAAIIGKAVYEGRINLKDLRNLC